jgi:hypothetical protein
MTEVRLAFKVGDWVIIERDKEQYPSKGTWPSYVNKVGRIIVVNIDEGNPNFPREEPYIEWGVRFTASGTESLHWFIESELALIEKPKASPDIKIHAERQGL